MNQLSYIIIFLIAIVFGMLIQMFLRKDIEYHGPNALSEMKKTYYNDKKNKCLKFVVEPVNCQN